MRLTVELLVFLMNTSVNIVAYNCNPHPLLINATTWNLLLQKNIHMLQLYITIRDKLTLAGNLTCHNVFFMFFFLKQELNRKCFLIGSSSWQYTEPFYWGSLQRTFAFFFFVGSCASPFLAFNISGHNSMGLEADWSKSMVLNSLWWWSVDSLFSENSEYLTHNLG